jgi:hypothetical protein
METTNGQITATANNSSSDHCAGPGSPSWLGGRRGLVVAGAVTLAAAAFAVSEHWLAVVDLVPLLFVLPCVLMIFMPMKGMNDGEQASTTPTTAHNEVLTTTEPRN